jgi:pimeloyl-ACP methyl ester carboxylesterase
MARILIAIVCALAALAPQSAKRDKAKAFAGEWMTSYGPMKLESKGSSLAGEYGWSGEARVEGKLDKERFAFDWSGPGGRGQGWFELWEDGQTLVGEFTPNGGQSGFCGAYRRAAQRAEPKPGAITDGQTESGLIYHLRVPKGFKKSERYTAVALFHGSNTNSRDYVEGFPENWPELGERFIVVGFDGERLSSASRDGVRAFNASYVEFSGHKVGEPWRYNQTPWLAAQALDQLKKELPIERWFVGGHSQGGFLTLAVTMFYPDRVAGAFPVAGNLLVQCEPSFFDDEKIRAAQRRVPIAIVHGEKDDLVEFSAATYTNDSLQDGGFPLLRLFNAPNKGHAWAFLPVDEALTWMETLASEDPELLIAFAEEAVEAQRWRDACGALARARESAKATALQERIDALSGQVDVAASQEAASLAKSIAANADAKWVDAFWEFRSRFAYTPAAQDVLEAYQKLRDDHQKPAEERFFKARGSQDDEQRKELYREIVEEYYASSYYRLVKGWI